MPSHNTVPTRIEQIDRVVIDESPAVERERVGVTARPAVFGQEAAHARPVVARAQIDQAGVVLPLAVEGIAGGAGAGRAEHIPMRIITPRERDVAAGVRELAHAPHGVIQKVAHPRC